MTPDPRHDPRFVEGLALLRRREWFLAHERIEEAWRDLPEGRVRSAVQGAIQVAVALEHLRRGNAVGAAKVWARARERWADLAPELTELGLAAWAGRVSAFLGGARVDERAAGADLPPLPPPDKWPALE